MINYSSNTFSHLICHYDTSFGVMSHSSPGLLLAAPIANVCCYTHHNTALRYQHAQLPLHLALLKYDFLRKIIHAELEQDRLSSKVSR